MRELKLICLNFSSRMPATIFKCRDADTQDTGGCWNTAGSGEGSHHVGLPHGGAQIPGAACEKQRWAGLALLFATTCRSGNWLEMHEL